MSLINKWCAHCGRGTKPVPPRTNWRCFEYENWRTNSDKFWSIRMDYDPTVVWLRYGKNGTQGTLIKKEFDWTYEAKEYYDKKVKEKLSEGYNEV